MGKDNAAGVTGECRQLDLGSGLWIGLGGAGESKAQKELD